MSLAKRLEEAAREGRVTEKRADEILSYRTQAWTGQDRKGQMALFLGFEKDKGVRK